MLEMEISLVINVMELHMISKIESLQLNYQRSAQCMQAQSKYQILGNSRGS